MKQTVADVKWLSTLNSLKRDKVNNDRPSTPDITPSIGAGTVLTAAIAYAAQNDASEWVRLTGIVCCALVLISLAYCEQRIRGHRNATEQVRIESSHQPSVLITNDPEGVADDLEAADE
jgi:hypothetical protein